MERKEYETIFFFMNLHYNWQTFCQLSTHQTINLLIHEKMLTLCSQNLCFHMNFVTWLNISFAYFKSTHYK